MFGCWAVVLHNMDDGFYFAVFGDGWEDWVSFQMDCVIINTGWWIIIVKMVDWNNLFFNYVELVSVPTGSLK